jgi:hypothetical protein
MAANKKTILGSSDKKKPGKKSSGVPSSNVSSSKILTARNSGIR